MQARSIVALALGSCALVACGSTPGPEDVAQSAQDLVTCPPPEVRQCTPIPHGLVCECVAAPPPPLTVTGTVSGLTAAESLVLGGTNPSIGGGVDSKKTITANGAYSFTMAQGDRYPVVFTQPAGQICDIQNDTGSLSNVAITCGVPGNVTIHVYDSPMGTGVAGITLWASIPGENPQALLTAGGPSGPCTFPFVEGDEVTISASWTSEETTPSVSQCWWDTYAPAGTGVATTALAGGTPHNLSCK